MLPALMMSGLLSQGAPTEVETPSKALILMEISSAPVYGCSTQLL